ncbi:hypothetical protein CRM22_010800 [Opisthorchis felineus]|uniref:Uncharacterized protein n=1 Tax=Opisthorchis felineus TaxID=147828 RepID=A0A4S2KL46_OPIFE|nr:hypothetical protein CRM22_010800 [Opisthorchis felineus]
MYVYSSIVPDAHTVSRIILWKEAGHLAEINKGSCKLTKQNVSCVIDRLSRDDGTRHASTIVQRHIQNRRHFVGCSRCGRWRVEDEAESIMGSTDHTAVPSSESETYMLSRKGVYGAQTKQTGQLWSWSEVDYFNLFIQLVSVNVLADP